MRIQRLLLDNFISHEHTVIEFEPGVTLIVGPNGAGKTSIIDAIAFALFDSRTRGDNNSSLIRTRSSRALIEVDFATGSSRYRVRREIPRRGSSESFLYRVDKTALQLIARGVRTVQKEIEKILALPSSTARKVLIAGQGELEDVLDRQRRIEYVDSVIGIKAMEKTREKLREIVNRIRIDYARTSEQKKSLEAQILELRERTRDKDEILEELKEKKEVEKRLSNAIEKIREEIRLVEDEIEKLVKIENEYYRLAGERRQLEGILNSLREEKERIIEAEEKYLRYKSIYDNLDKISTYRILRERQRSVLKRIREEKRQLQVLIAALGDKRIDINKVAESFAEYQHRARKIREELERLEGLYTEYETARKEYLRRKDELRQIEKTMDKIRSKYIQSIRNYLSLLPSTPLAIEEPTSLQEFLKQYKDELEEELNKLNASIEKLSNEIGALRAKINDIGERLSKLTSARRECPLCGQPLTEEHRIKLIKRLRNEKLLLEKEYYIKQNDLEKMKQKQIELRKQINKLAHILEELGRHVGRYEELEKRKEELKKTINALEKRIVELMAPAREYQDLNQELREIEKLMEHYMKINNVVARLTSLEKELSEIESDIEVLVSDLLAKSVVQSADDLERVSEDIETLRQEKAFLEHTISRKDEITKKITEIERRLEEVDKELKRLEEFSEKTAELKKKREQLERDYDVLSKRRENVIRTIAALEARLDEIKRLETRLKELEKRLKNVSERVIALEKLLHDLESMRKALKEKLPVLVRRQAKTLMEYHMRHILRHFNIDFIDIRIDDSFDVLLYGRSGERTLSMLSGGERIALALAFRLALASIIAPRAGILVFDEPTVFLDEENRRELIRIIRDSIGRISNLEQLIIVSHDRELEEAADQVIEVYRDQQGVSRVRKSVQAYTMTA